MLFSRLDLPVDFATIRNEIRTLLSASWVDHVNAGGYGGKWDVLPLRTLKEHHGRHPILQAFSIDSHGHWADLDILKRCSSLQKWLASFQCPLKSVRLMRLAPGGHIRPHRDPGLDWRSGEARLHLPIWTDTNVHFIVKGQSVPMQAGELWYINAGEVHEVRNDSERDRIHLVIDCEVNDWLFECFDDDSVMSA
ncbi:aspartyl/asparaginyl beta-hydroxylase domain-containing protein [Gynuella sunshinyii]|uniref:Aspartyl/asparaginyl beta-hydroxylase and related dioxygenase n=1 Tax=Gynuella sunshinyii YC6258 TaxID=1445510 RepID=A0A0C5VFJ7_9GAMM|nr:aspartyl/asparaginyl beta-hydroxylase domain-containing protein [Gynuella sunshinyii]AJQ93322.1 aspartyl/asparaginyl beta-hydroxylase and related dioxygenase [Gynuella sunshinyii YC6258]